MLIESYTEKKVCASLPYILAQKTDDKMLLSQKSVFWSLLDFKIVTILTVPSRSCHLPAADRTKMWQGHRHDSRHTCLQSPSDGVFESHCQCPLVAEFSKHMIDNRRGEVSTEISTENAGGVVLRTWVSRQRRYLLYCTTKPTSEMSVHHAANNAKNTDDRFRRQITA